MTASNQKRKEHIMKREKVCHGGTKGFLHFLSAKKEDTMKHFVRIVGVVALGLLAGSSPAIGAVDTGDEPLCGADGICNIAVCNNDPDCPDDLPTNDSGGGSTPTDSPDRPEDIIDCTSQEVTEIGLAIDSVSSSGDWNDFVDFIEDESGITIGNCLENRFKTNGKVVCESSSGGQCNGANGWASYLNKRAHFCPSFLDTVDNISGVENRKACYFALAAHEFSHTCWRDHGTTEDIDDLAFEYYKDHHPGVTISMSSCGMD
jgi:hypothetical protein